MLCTIIMKVSIIRLCILAAALLSHSIASAWDGLPGKKATPQAYRNEAREIEMKYTRKSLTELIEHATPKEWSLEGRRLAIDKGYLHGELKGSTSEETAFPLPDGYVATAKAVAERRVALAGYRLADEIRHDVK